MLAYYQRLALALDERLEDGLTMLGADQCWVKASSGEHEVLDDVIGPE